MTETAPPQVAPIEHSTTTFLARPGWLERLGVTVAIFVFSFSLPTDWFQQATSSPDAESSGGVLTQVVFLSFLAIALIGINGNWPIAISAMNREPLLAMLIGLAALSAFWSTSFGGTFQDVVVLTITLIVAIHLVVRFEIEEILLYTGIALLFGMIANYLFIFAFQDVGLDTINVGTDGGAKWSGVYSTKNELGRIAALSALVFGFLVRLRRSVFVWPICVVLALIQVIASDSATSLGASGGLVALTLVFLGFRGRKTLYGATAVALATVFSLLTLLAATSLANVTGLVGKDATFTGRLPLWVSSFRLGIAERPWFGYGWLGFWGDDSAFAVKLDTNFNTPHAHNAFIDAWLYMGPTGAVLLAAIYVRSLVWGARTVRADPTPAGLFPILMVSYGLIFSLTEAGVVRRDISFVLFVIAVLAAARQKGVRQPFVASTGSPEGETSGETGVAREL